MLKRLVDAMVLFFASQALLFGICLVLHSEAFAAVKIQNIEAKTGVSVSGVLTAATVESKRLNVQGKLTDKSGNPIAGTHILFFRLYDVATAGTALWIEQQNVDLGTDGLFNVKLGEAVSLDNLPFNKQYHLGISVDGDSEMAPRQMLGASSYALGSVNDFDVAKNLNVAGNAAVAGNLVVGTPSAPATLRLNGGINLLPPGVIMTFGAAAAPEGWLLCDGSAVSRTTYAALFGVIGTTYGAGDTVTTFNVPNMKGKVAVGCNASETEFNALGKTGGDKIHTHTNQQHTHTLSNHTHGVNINTSPANYASASTTYRFSTASPKEAHSHITSGNTETPSDNVTGDSSDLDMSTISSLQPYITLNYIIKY